VVLLPARSIHTPDPYEPPVRFAVTPPAAPPAAPVPNSWYYCEGAKGYYPYVPTCPGGWKKVPANPRRRRIRRPRRNSPRAGKELKRVRRLARNPDEHRGDVLTGGATSVPSHRWCFLWGCAQMPAGPSVARDARSRQADRNLHGEDQACRATARSRRRQPERRCCE